MFVSLIKIQINKNTAHTVIAICTASNKHTINVNDKAYKINTTLHEKHVDEEQ